MLNIINVFKENNSILEAARLYALRIIAGEVPLKKGKNVWIDFMIQLSIPRYKKHPIHFHQILTEPYRKKIKEKDILYGESFALFFVDWLDVNLKDRIQRDEFAWFMAAFIILYIMVLEIDDYVDEEADLKPDFGSKEADDYMSAMGDIFMKEFIKYEPVVLQFINTDPTHSIENKHGIRFNRKQLIRFKMQSSWIHDCFVKMNLLVFHSSLYHFEGKNNLVEWFMKTKEYIEQARSAFIAEKNEEKLPDNIADKLLIASGKNSLLLIQAELLDQSNMTKEHSIVEVVKMLLRPFQLSDDLQDWWEDYSQKKRTYLLSSIANWEMSKEELVYNLTMHRYFQETMELILKDIDLVQIHLSKIGRINTILGTYLTTVYVDLQKRIMSLDKERNKVLKLKDD